MRRWMLCRWLAMASVAMLAACASSPSAPPLQAGPQTAMPVAPVAAPRMAYQIDPAASTLHILVYRGGTLARLGHNHVISSHHITGSIWHAASLADSGFDITVPVQTLVVDDSSARAAEGEDFAASVSEDARQGTHANMLRAALLDADRYPDIHIRSTTIQGDTQAPTVTAEIRIKAQTRLVTLPVVLSVSESDMRVVGAFNIRQTDFGITPLSVALGALQVQDTLSIKFELVARAP